MSCYEWEEGTIKLPSKDYSSIRKDFVKRLNSYKQKEMDNAARLREDVLRQGKGKRGFLYYSKMVDLMSKYSVSYDVLDLMFKNRSYSSSEKPKVLTKKAMNFAKANDTHFENSDCVVAFNNKQRTVSWYVPENNHACEHARETNEGRALFGTLRNVKWTARTGGTIVGNNEYNRDDHNAGGGGNYVVEEFSKKESERMAKASRYGTYGYGAYHNPY